MTKTVAKTDDSALSITTYQSGVVQSSAFRALKKHTAQLLKEHDMTTMQWFIVGTIYDAGPVGIRLTDLATKLDTGLPFLTNTLNLLESKGMVQRLSHANDNRSRMVSVTPAFKKKCPGIERDLRNKLRKSLYLSITPEELSTYIAVLHKLSHVTA